MIIIFFIYYYYLLSSFNGCTPIENIEKLENLYPGQIKYISDHFFDKNCIRQLQTKGILYRPKSTWYLDNICDKELI